MGLEGRHPYNCQERILASTRPSVCLRRTTLFSLDGFSGNVIFEPAEKIPALIRSDSNSQRKPNTHF